MAGELFLREGVPWWRDPRNGREYHLGALIRSTRRDAVSYEIRKDTTDKELYRKIATRSIDVPGSPESRIVKIDNAQQHIIRACGVLMPVLNDEPLEDYQFYNARMSQAIQYLADKHGFRFGSNEYKNLSAFLWAIYHNRHSSAVESICRAVGITFRSYYRRIDTYRADLDEPEWKMITDLADKLISQFKSGEKMEDCLLPPEKT